MSRLRIKLRLPTSEDSPSSPSAAAHPADTSANASTNVGDDTTRHTEDLASDSEDELLLDDAANQSTSTSGVITSSTPNGGSSKSKKSSAPLGSPSPSTSSSSKRRSVGRDDVGNLTMEELDALPPAKRRKGAKARGAPGPGRGWRKGLKMGQKPVYNLPDSTPIAQGTPSSFTSPDQSPAPGATKSPEPAAATTTTTTTTKAAASKGKSSSSHTAATTPSGTPAVAGQFVGNVAHSAAAAPTGKQILPSGRPSQPVAAAMSFGPPVKLPPKLLNTAPVATASGPTSTGGSSTTTQQPALPPGAPPITILDRDPSHKPRRWVREAREIVNLGGRVVKVKTWWGGSDISYDPAAEREKEEAAKEKARSEAAKQKALLKQQQQKQASQAQNSTPTPVPADDSLAAESPSASRTSPPSKATPVVEAAASPPPTATTASNASSNASPSRLPKPKFQPGGGTGSADWRGGAVGKR
ncbi:unnamed protein product [Sympodiomycopsis kandeliae]